MGEYEYEFTEDYIVRPLKITPIYSIVFSHEQGKEIGRLEWESGKMEFSGEIEESAKVFFEYLKGYIDIYINERLEKPGGIRT